MVVMLFSIFLWGNWPLTLEEVTHLVVFEKANKHCKPAATVRKPNKKLPGESPCQVILQVSIHPIHSPFKIVPKNMLHRYCSQYPPWESTHPNFVRIMISKGTLEISCCCAFTIQARSPTVSYISLLKTLHRAFHIHSGDASYSVFAPVIKMSLLTKNSASEKSIWSAFLTWSDIWHSEISNLI